MTADDIARERERVIAEARTWMGTPFHSGARIKGAGVDCAQLLIACYADIGLVSPVVTGAYPADWYLAEDASRILPFFAGRCTGTLTPSPGDIVVFRFGRAVSHAGILIDDQTIIHALYGQGVVFGSLEVTHDLWPRFAGYWTLNRWTVGE